MRQAALVDFKSIQDLGDQIAREFHPQRIILFGSYANGTPTQDSDVDLLVILPLTGSPVHKAVEIRLKVNPPFPVDLIVRSPKQIEKRLAMGDTFIADILKNGEVLYEACNK